MGGFDLPIKTVNILLWPESFARKTSTAIPRKPRRRRRGGFFCEFISCCLDRMLCGVPPARGGGRKTASILNYDDEKALPRRAWGMGALILPKLDLGQVLWVFLQSFPHLITMSPERSLSSSRSESEHRVTVVDALSCHSQLAEKNISLPQAADSEVKVRTPVPEDSQRTTPPPVHCIKTGWAAFQGWDLHG